MTSDEVKAKIVKAIHNCLDNFLTAEEITAEVLALCGPKPLEWRENADPDSEDFGKIIAQNANAWLYYKVHKNYFNEYYLSGSVSFGQPPFKTLEAAQSAAKDHYEAAHWANTPLKDL